MTNEESEWVKKFDKHFEKSFNYEYYEFCELNVRNFIRELHNEHKHAEEEAYKKGYIDGQLSIRTENN